MKFGLKKASSHFIVVEPGLTKVFMKSEVNDHVTHMDRDVHRHVNIPCAWRAMTELSKLYVEFTGHGKVLTKKSFYA